MRAHLEPTITMVFSSRWYQPDFKGPPMGGCLVAGLPHLCSHRGPGCHPLLLLPKGDGQGERGASLLAKGPGSCQQSKLPLYPTLVQAPAPTNASSFVTLNVIPPGHCTSQFTKPFLGLRCLPQQRRPVSISCLSHISRARDGSDLPRITGRARAALG